MNIDVIIAQEKEYDPELQYLPCEICRIKTVCQDECKSFKAYAASNSVNQRERIFLDKIKLENLLFTV